MRPAVLILNIKVRFSNPMRYKNIIKHRLCGTVVLWCSGVVAITLRKGGDGLSPGMSHPKVGKNFTLLSPCLGLSINIVDFGRGLRSQNDSQTRGHCVIASANGCSHNSMLA